MFLPRTILLISSPRFYPPEILFGCEIIYYIPHLCDRSYYARSAI
jgi:hypothetical protein